MKDLKDKIQSEEQRKYKFIDYDKIIKNIYSEVKQCEEKFTTETDDSIF